MTELLISPSGGERTATPPRPAASGLSHTPRLKALWYGLFGALLGYAVLHPGAMIIRNITDYTHGRAPFAPAAEILHSFDPQMWPMAALYAVLGTVFWSFYGLHTGRIKEQQERLRQDLEEIRTLAARLDYEQRVVKMLEAGYRHSWKNKLVGIVGLARRLEKREEGPVKEMAGCLRRCGEELFRELGENLEISKIVSTDMLPASRGDVHELIVACVGEPLRTRFAGKQPRVSINGRPWNEAQGSLPWEFNRTTLRHVLDNVLTNAMRFGSRVAVRYRSEGPELVIEVEDDGPGMSAEQVAEVFDPGAAPHERGGSHLGMAYSKMIIDRYGGRIDYRTAPGQGTTCLIRLPAKASVKAPQQPTS